MFHIDQIRPVKELTLISLLMLKFRTKFSVLLEMRCPIFLSEKVDCELGFIYKVPLLVLLIFTITVVLFQSVHVKFHSCKAGKLQKANKVLVNKYDFHHCLDFIKRKEEWHKGKMRVGFEEEKYL